MRLPECEFRNESTGWQWMPWDWNKSGKAFTKNEAAISHFVALMSGEIVGGHTAGGWQEIRLKR